MILLFLLKKELFQLNKVIRALLLFKFYDEIFKLLDSDEQAVLAPLRVIRILSKRQKISALIE